MTPRQHSSAGQTVLLGISKHGDRDLRTLLIHGARSTLYGKRCSSTPEAGGRRASWRGADPRSRRSRWATTPRGVLRALLSRGQCCARV